MIDSTCFAWTCSFHAFHYSQSRGMAYLSFARIAGWWIGAAKKLEGMGDFRRLPATSSGFQRLPAVSLRFLMPPDGNRPMRVVPFRQDTREKGSHPGFTPGVHTRGLRPGFAPGVCAICELWLGSRKVGKAQGWEGARGFDGLAGRRELAVGQNGQMRGINVSAVMATVSAMGNPTRK